MATQTNWRTINIDLLDPESSSNFNTLSLAQSTTTTTANTPTTPAQASSIGMQIRQLLRGGDAEGALRGALGCVPYAASEGGVKEIHLATVVEILQSIKQAEMSPMLERIYASEAGTETLDVLMKYLYKGMAQSSHTSSKLGALEPQSTGFSQIHSRGGGEGGGQAMSVLLSWHEKLVEIAGAGSIIRVLTDRRTV